MRTPSLIPPLAAAAAVALGAVVAVRASAAEGNEDITAVSSHASADYVRARLPDGSFAPEEYSFGEGGHYGGPMHDETIDSLKFLDIARVIAVPLASQHYLPAHDPKKAKLLIMLYWGTTNTPSSITTSSGYQGYQNALQSYNQLMNDPLLAHDQMMKNYAQGILNNGLIQASMENKERDHLDYTNAALLGYDSEGIVGTEYGIGLQHTALRAFRQDLVTEIEDTRYFVVLMAYDFQMLWKTKQHKELWETRFSISQRRNNFAKVLPAMAQYASKYFGEDSRGLVRRSVPLGEVRVGQVTSLGDVEEPAK